MQRLLFVYFAALFVFAGLIFIAEYSSPSDEADAKSAGHTEAEEVVESMDAVEETEKAVETEAMEETKVSNREQRGGVATPSQQQAAPVSFEQPYLELGYRAVEDAVRDCERRFMERIHLPIYVPPLAFTHRLGKCQLNFDETDQLEIHYMHEQKQDHHYMILVRPTRYKVEFPDSRIERTIALQDGSNALHSMTPNYRYHVLSFEKGNWQYIFTIPKSLEDAVPPDELVKAANSLRLYYPLAINPR